MSGSLDVGFTGELAKFSLRALRLPASPKREINTAGSPHPQNNMYTKTWTQATAANHLTSGNVCVYALAISPSP